jgi:hypothetical protein
MLISFVVLGIKLMSGGYYWDLTFTSFLIGLWVIIVGAVAARIFCELLIVIFKINETLKDMNSK